VTAEFEEIAPYVVFADVSTVEVPRDGTRIVQVGANAMVNFVKALSIIFPLFTNPVSARVESAESHARFALGAELRTTDAIAPVFETRINTPSRTPTNFLPANVSALLPKTDTVPSVWRTTVLSAVFDVPMEKTLPNTPVDVALRTNGLSSNWPTIDTPFAEMERA